MLPGGFPEEHTAELSANERLRAQITQLAGRAPVHAECAGLTYLLTDLDGYPMCGVLAGSARFTERLTLGYRDVVAVTDSPAYATGQRAVGHEFHRTAVTFTDDYLPAWVRRGEDGAPVRDGAVRGGVHAAYLHTHPAAHPESVRRFVEHAAGAATTSCPVTDNPYLVGLRLAGKKVVVVGRGKCRAASARPADRQRCAGADHCPRGDPRRRGDGGQRRCDAGVARLPRRRPGPVPVAETSPERPPTAAAPRSRRTWGGWRLLVGGGAGAVVGRRRPEHDNEGTEG
ncbi:Hydrogenobyrinate a,c-diamide synthase [Mycobacterium talmoniae]|uniref:Hydrogenobyrinate a,c-diamide synthase n=1 Tax=Mycobacterium talmoniae TaxID=1858794 RepID=A0A2S8BCQ3_9MYCO|nr:Hydrogenobyrinate a,c-diamide synthase [Mycobacterium talmoniae]